MPLGKSLRGLFIDDTPSPGETPKSVAPVVTNHPAAPVGPSSAETRAIDEALQQKMLSAVNTAGIVGYKALDDVLDSLADVVADEGLRYKKALEICAKQGYTPLALLNDIDKAIGILEEQSRVFEADQKKQFLSSVGALTKSVETSNQQLAEGEKQLQALQEKLAGIRQKRDADAAAISTEQAQIDHVNSRFTTVYQLLMREVQDQRVAVEQRTKVHP